MRGKFCTWTRNEVIPATLPTGVLDQSTLGPSELGSKWDGGSPLPPALELGAHLQHWDSGDRMESSSWECRPNLEGETGFQADPPAVPPNGFLSPLPQPRSDPQPGVKCQGSAPSSSSSPKPPCEEVTAKHHSFVHSFIHSLTTEGQTPGRSHALCLQG